MIDCSKILRNAALPDVGKCGVSHTMRLLLDVNQMLSGALTRWILLICGNHSDRAARVVAFLVDFDLHRYSILQFFDVADDAHMAA